MGLLLSPCLATVGLMQLGGGNRGGSAPVVQAATFSISVPASNGGSVGTATATNSPTGWSITAGDPSGDFAISSAGAITFTSQGATDYDGTSSLKSATLMLKASNSSGVGTGDNTVNAYADGSVNAVAATVQKSGLVTLQTVVALNVTPGSGYTNGTGYAWTSSGGGCGSNASGTVDVVGGVLTNGVISFAGSNCTSIPTIAVPAGAGAGSGGSIVPSVYQARPPWKIAGVDYNVGPASGTSFSDPTTATLPSGCTYTANSGGSSYNHVSCTNNNTVFNGWDFTVAGNGRAGVSLEFATGTTGNVVENSKFCDGIGADGGNDIGGIIHFSNHGAGGSITLTNDDISGTCSGQSVGPEGGLIVQNQTGSIIFEYNYCHDFAQHCVDVSEGSGLTNSGSKLNYNLILNSGLESGAHGEFAYYCGGTITSISQNFNAMSNAYLVSISNTANFAMAADSGCGSPGYLTSADTSYNLALGQGPQSGSSYPYGNSNSYTTGYVFDTQGTASSSITATGNYVDYTGGYGPFYSGNQAGVTLSNNINAVTGHACSLAACN